MSTSALIELLSIIISVLIPVIGGVTWYLVRYRKYKNRYFGLKKEMKELNRELSRLTNENRQHNANKRELEWRRTELQRQIKEQAQWLQTSQQVIDEQEERFVLVNDQISEIEAQHRVAIGEKEEQLQQAQSEIRGLQEQIELAVEHKGRVWERGVPGNVPEYVPLAVRRCPIISIINLKGGVGKSTITANLGMILAQRKKRVLMIDLDYQRSLTKMCFDAHSREVLTLRKRCLQHFLLAPAPGAAFLLHCAKEVEEARGCHLIMNSEKIATVHVDLDPASVEEPGLEDAEMNLLARWLVDPSKGDVRYFLRKALHAPAIREQFDYVLLDCPPRLSTACINALAASDFALTPILLDLPSADPTHNLLRKVRQFQKSSFLRELRLLGIVANRAAKNSTDGLTKAQSEVWINLKESAQQVWREPVYFFRSAIRQSPNVANAAASFTFAARYDDMHEAFTNLLNEMEERIERERSRSAAISSELDRAPARI